MPTMSCMSQKPEKYCCYGRVSRLWTLKTPVFMARKRWRHDVTMFSENSQGYLWIPCEFCSSLANQIMCNKQSALELLLLSSPGNLPVHLYTREKKIHQQKYIFTCNDGWLRILFNNKHKIYVKQSSRKKRGSKTLASKILAGSLIIHQVLATLWRK